jgi:CubicO group peptidase (beta-lactamase class C family)
MAGAALATTPFEKVSIGATEFLKISLGSTDVWSSESTPPTFDSIGAGATVAPGNLTWSQTIAGDGIIAWVSSGIIGPPPTPTLTVGGVSATLVGSWICGSSGGANIYLRCFRLLNPPTGVKSIVYTGGGYSTGNSVSYFGVTEFGDPVLTTGANGAMSVSIPDSSEGALYSLASTYVTGATYTGFNQTQRYLKPAAAGVNNALLIGDAVGNGGVLSFTATRSTPTTGWGAVVVPINPVPVPGKMSQTDRDSVDAIVLAAMIANGQIAQMVSITGPAGDYDQAYGTTGARPITTADHFRMGSVTKTFTGTAIFMQIDRGNLALTDFVETYIPGIPNGSSMTIQHCLMMRSGIVEFYTALATNFALNPTGAYSSEQALAAIKAGPAGFAPGTSYQYTNGNFILLGLVLEAITGRRIEDILTEDIIVPLGLTETGWPTSGVIPTPFVNGYGANPLAFIPFAPPVTDQTAWQPELAGAAGALTTTIGDLQKWGQALRDGALLSPASAALRDSVFCPYPQAQDVGTGPNEFAYGLGFVSYGEWLGHDGSVPGYECCTMFEPTSGAVIATMANYQTPGLQAFLRTFHRIGEYLYPGSMDKPTYSTCPY